ncbi:hypothetical protein F66182_5083 [Fusarium sp. NRRL 66182]|nr:hypothetical protein F66182_5083 [Fusarium sp. NRRL 66182]
MAPQAHKRALPVEILIGCWALSSILVKIFACSLSSPWDYINSECADMVAVWIYIDVLNMVTDLVITGIFVHMVASLQMPSGTKAMVVGVFGSRLLVMPPVACHIYYYQRALNSTSPIFDMWKPAVIVQVIQCVGITTTCIPFFMRFLKTFESGQMGAGDLFGSASKSSNSRTGNATRGAARSRAALTMASSASGRQGHELTSKPGSEDRRKFANIMTAHVRSRSWDAARQTSQEALVDPSCRVDVETDNTASDRT